MKYVFMGRAAAGGLGDIKPGTVETNNSQNCEFWRGGGTRISCVREGNKY